MAPQESIPVAANILGTIGTVCWCVQLIPQIIRNYRTKSTEGLPASMMLLWTLSGVPFSAYAIAQNFNTPLIVQPQCFCFLCGVSWGQCLVYGSKWRTWTTTLLLTILFILFAGLEIGLVYAIRLPYQRGVDWPVLLVGIVSFILLIGAYFGIPIELLKRRGRVIGIDFIFLTVDWCGAFFSLMSLVAQSEFDVLFGTMYALCCTIEMSMVVSHLIWKLRTRGIRKGAKAEGETFDESTEGREWQAKGIDLEAKFWNLVGRKDMSDNENAEEGVIEERVADGKNTVPIGIA
ncbi:PQ loop repeat protein [Bimuria novae-zelandiae CBS 107.79]|uniref:PQ loop repeat protein n=1 Tax=Bimuria novae-zelandiae CBS 107.79 TaxID=1447943 RepID=A0A6A5UWX0_9PLEO|nr:PQ loop repeat protein [Bimuria novae-zelandiae CBS 107.79]